MRLAFLLLAFFAVGACAQMPADLAARVRELGPVIDPPKTSAIYAPLHSQSAYDGVKIERDVRYAPVERQVLDIFAPAAGAKDLPVLVFVHGGGFVAGNKRGPDGSPFYDNIALAAVKAGMIGVNITYNLAPKHAWPQGRTDVELAIEWVHDNIARHGGNRGRIFLMGHSAGAVHAASYLTLHERSMRSADPAPGVAGAILVSGLYDFTKLEAGPGEKAYFGAKAGTEEVSSLKGVVERRKPLLLVHAELDPPRFIEQSKLLNEALCKAGRCPTLVELKGHSHMSEVYAIGTGDDTLWKAILTFVKENRYRR